MEKIGNTGKLIGGLLLATAIGGLVAGLLAGKRMTKSQRLVKEMEEAKDVLEKKFKKFIKSAKTELAEAKARSKELIEKSAAKAERFKIS